MGSKKGRSEDRTVFVKENVRINFRRKMGMRKERRKCTSQVLMEGKRKEEGGRGADKKDNAINYLIKGSRNKASVTSHFTLACAMVGLVLVNAQPIVKIPCGCMQINDLESGLISLKPSKMTSCG